MKNTMKQQLNNQKAVLAETMFRGLGRMAMKTAYQSSECCSGLTLYESKIPKKLIKR